MGLPKRKPNRLETYDYSQPGYYFITICTQDMKQLLCRGEHGSPAAGHFPLSDIGIVVDRAIRGIKTHYTTAWADKYVIMPNHVHLILVLSGEGRRTLCAPTPIHPLNVPRVIKQLKAYVTKQLGRNIWQKGYHDHVIRTEADYLRIWRYIDTNPVKWADDCYYEEGVSLR